MSKLTPEEYKLLDKMNKRLRTWVKNNMSNEVINQIQNDLTIFYTKYNIDAPSRNIMLFKKSNRYTDQEKQELLRIAQAMNKAKSSKISYYRKMPTDNERLQKAFQSVRNNPLYNVNTFVDYIQWVDDMNNAKEIVAQLMEIDSDLVARTYGYGKEHNLTSEDINMIMKDAVDNYRDGDTMEQFLQNEIEKKEKNNYINLSLAPSIYDYASKKSVPEHATQSIIDTVASNPEISMSNVEDTIYQKIDEWKPEKDDDIL